MRNESKPTVAGTASRWIFIMEYCKKRGIPPAQKWAWDAATKAYNEYLKGVEKK